MAMLLVILAACTPQVPKSPPLGLVLAPDGLRPETSDLEVGFGRARQGATDAATRILGEQPSRQEQLVLCGVAVDWASGLRMIFVNGAFRGWTAPPGRYTTMGGPYGPGPDGRIGAGETCRDG
ncbi:MAG: hypothetical protein GY717_10210 [Rhodobacteraceae bacterium]|nr:hypothetical protein [Paracoccaceae bacterium]